MLRLLAIRSLIRGKTDIFCLKFGLLGSFLGLRGAHLIKKKRQAGKIWRLQAAAPTLGTGSSFETCPEVLTSVASAIN